MTIVNALYSGSIKFLEPDGDKTGIYKDPVESVQIDENGIIGDIQADRRFHGGREKALHQYSIFSYSKITKQFSELESIAVAGSIGENISSNDLDDSNVNIGDVYQIGAVIVQISQPRSPCWKINNRFNQNKLAKFIVNNQITGWYYRVIEGGRVSVNDEIKRFERYNQSVSIEQFTRVAFQHRPPVELLQQLIDCPGLNRDWQNKLIERRDYQIKNPSY